VGDSTPSAPVTFCLGNINPGMVYNGYVQTLLALAQSPTSAAHNTRFDRYLVKSPAGPYLDVQRNVVVQEFLRTDADVLVFLDADMECDVETLHELAAVAHDQQMVVGGRYINNFPECASDGGFRPISFHWITQVDPDGRTWPRLWPVENALPDDLPPETAWEGLHSVDVIGTGLMAIPRFVFDRLSEVFDAPTPWFAEVAMNGVQMGEDVTFCARVKYLHIDVGYAPWLTAKHYKTICLDPAIPPSFKYPTTVTSQEQ